MSVGRPPTGSSAEQGMSGLVLDEALRNAFADDLSPGPDVGSAEDCLLAFAREYHRANPHVFASPDCVEALSMALTLLSANLHGDLLSPGRGHVSRDDFVEYVMRSDPGMVHGIDVGQMYERVKERRLTAGAHLSSSDARARAIASVPTQRQGWLQILPQDVAQGRWLEAPEVANQNGVDCEHAEGTPASVDGDWRRRYVLVNDLGVHIFRVVPLLWLDTELTASFPLRHLILTEPPDVVESGEKSHDFQLQAQPLACAPDSLMSKDAPRVTPSQPGAQNTRPSHITGDGRALVFRMRAANFADKQEWIESILRTVTAAPLRAGFRAALTAAEGLSRGGGGGEAQAHLEEVCPGMTPPAGRKMRDRRRIQSMNRKGRQKKLDLGAVKPEVPQSPSNSGPSSKTGDSGCRNLLWPTSPSDGIDAESTCLVADAVQQRQRGGEGVASDIENGKPMEESPGAVAGRCRQDQGQGSKNKAGQGSTGNESERIAVLAEEDGNPETLKSFREWEAECGRTDAWNILNAALGCNADMWFCRQVQGYLSRIGQCRSGWVRRRRCFELQRLVCHTWRVTAARAARVRSAARRVRASRAQHELEFGVAALRAWAACVWRIRAALMRDMAIDGADSVAACVGTSGRGRLLNDGNDDPDRQKAADAASESGAHGVGDSRVAAAATQRIAGRFSRVTVRTDFGGSCASQISPRPHIFPGHLLPQAEAEDNYSARAGASATLLPPAFHSAPASTPAPSYYTSDSSSSKSPPAACIAHDSARAGTSSWSPAAQRTPAPPLPPRSVSLSFEGERRSQPGRRREGGHQEIADGYRGRGGGGDGNVDVDSPGDDGCGGQGSRRAFLESVPGGASGIGGEGTGNAPRLSLRDLLLSGSGCAGGIPDDHDEQEGLSGDGGDDVGSLSGLHGLDKSPDQVAWSF